MAAVIGLELQELADLCDATDGVVAPANINSPGQVVISGESGAVDSVAEVIAAEADRRRRVVPLDVSVPSHCELMRPAADGVAQLLLETTMNEPTCKVVQNYAADSAADVDGIRERLIAQLSNPVRWADCVTTMVQLGCTAFLECGPGKVLTGLFRRIDRSLVAKPLSSTTDFEAALAEYAS